MGSAVWEFMWCIDKITKINNKGEGIVLGGKPIKLREIGMGHDNTVSRNIAKLDKEGYIKTVRTAYGLIIRVQKAKKKFGKRAESPRIVIHQNPYILPAFGESPTDNGESNKTLQRHNRDTTKTRGVLKEPQMPWRKGKMQSIADNLKGR